MIFTEPLRRLYHFYRSFQVNDIIKKKINKLRSVIRMILVVGSVNVDLVSFTSRFPKPGETIAGRDFAIYQGGKGANQAVAAAKLGADVEFLGAVGKDTFGDFLLKSLKESNVDITKILHVKDHSGVASIWVDSKGENSIILSAGANAHLSPELIESSSEAFKNSSYVLLQLEVPLNSVIKSAQIARSFGAKVILDPAPARTLPDELLKNVDYITPNETELSLVSQGEGMIPRIRWLENHGLQVIVKAGANGVYFMQNHELTHLEAFAVETVDTTGAGDCFNASLGVALSGGMSLKNACKFAMAASAISVTKKGAGASFPTKEEVEKFLEERGVVEIG